MGRQGYNNIGVMVHTMLTHGMTSLGRPTLNTFYLGTTDGHDGYHWSRCHTPLATFCRFLGISDGFIYLHFEILTR